MKQNEFEVINADEINRPLLLVGCAYVQDEPGLLVDDLKTQPVQRFRVSMRGKVFSLIRMPPRYCIGRYDILTDDEQPCPSSSRVDARRSDHCHDCYQSIGFNPGFYNDSPDKISDKQHQYHLLPHNVYLANFGKDLTKVGISQQDRTKTRWLEQGARAATILKRCSNAYEARKLEESIAREVKIPEVIRAQTKRVQLMKPFHADQAKQEISEVMKKIQTQINITPQGSEIETFDHIYTKNQPLDFTRMHDLTGQTEKQIGGTCLGMVGDLIILRKDGITYFVSLKDYSSYLVNIKAGDDVITPQTQISLF